jgi:CTD nuclear envelope phosphatase 1
MTGTLLTAHPPATYHQANTAHLTDLPAVKPSAIALGTVFNHTVELAVLTPVFGQTYQRAKTANTKEEFIRSREATGAAVAWGTALVGSALQSYGVGALINATGTLSYKGAAYLGGLIFAATSAPTVRLSLVTVHGVWGRIGLYC